MRRFQSVDANYSQNKKIQAYIKYEKELNSDFER